MIRLRHLALALVLCPVGTPATGQVPAPAEILGFVPGTDYKLARYEAIVRYFRALDAASDRVIVEEIGKSTLGKPLLLTLISTEENLSNREHYREISRRLALANDLSPEEARRLAKDGKSIIWIDGGLHATEVAHGQMTPELAHWLATDESDEARRIRENAIVLVMPNMNPDGLDIVVNWYEPNVGTPFELSPIPELYHPYIGHDNNRDWYMFTQVETQAVARQLYHVWFPQIVYNHHQSSPFPGRIWGPPFENPVNPNLDPLVVSQINQIGEAMRARFDFEGKPGYNSGIVFDMWWNGSMRGAPDFHNMLGFLTETALHRYATPRCYDESEVPQDFGERADFLPARYPSTNYTNPWLGGCWHLRDAVDYMLTASRAVMDHGAKLKEDLLYNIYHVGARQIARGEAAEGGPFAYLIDPAAQHDPGAAVELLRTLRLGGIEIRQAEAPFSAGGNQYPAGTYVIPPQSFRPYVVDLMEPKQFPDRRIFPGGPPNPPYDMTGYELSLQMGVAPDRVREPFPLPSRVVDQVGPHPGGVRGEGRWGYLLAPTSNNAIRAVNRLLSRGARVARTDSATRTGDQEWAPGTWVVRGVNRARADEVGRELGVELHGIAEAPRVATTAVRSPRIGIYRSHTAPMPEGWTRWVLEQYEFNYESLSDSDVRAGELARYDIVILPDQSASSILSGHAPGTMPEEYTGGLGPEGAAALRRYVENGGWLLAFDEAVDFPIAQFGLPFENSVSGLRSEDFFIPGSLINLRVDSRDPLAYGMPEQAIAMFARSQALETASATAAGSVGEPTSYVRYAADDFLASGWAMGAERYLADRIAATRVPLGRGQVVLLAFSPHFRGQPHNTYKLLFNPLFAATQRRAR